MKRFSFLLAVLLTMTTAYAQRTTDRLDRGLVAMKVSGGVYLSWRILADEYYDVSYNVYRNGTKLNEAPLSVSNYTDKGGSTTANYTVRAVVNGIEQEASKAITPWGTSYKEINLKHEGIRSTLIPNDACCADVDGDGELEILMKFDNKEEIENCFLKEGWYGEHSIMEILKMDGTRLWWVNCGPNMGDFQNNEQNIVAYDWDQDGKAEVVMRLEEGSVIHMRDGSTYTIGANGQNGSSWTNYRDPAAISSWGGTTAIATGLSASATVACSASWATAKIVDGIAYATATNNTTGAWRSVNVTVTDNGKTKSYGFGQKYRNADDREIGAEWFTHYGNEFLVYCNGETGEPYVVTEFPLKRLESDESNLEKAWGDGYGHRSSKFLFSAPYLDGRKPSIFLARGIYTRHKMIAYDVNPTTHQLTERWRWNNNSGGAWRGQGYHNYAVADVDMDGRDEIVFGSMVIDDNGMGLSTTGLGHGDAEHVADLNPYIHGLEIFACQEDNAGTNYRDATTSKFYFRYQNAPKDVGRCMAGNFSNNYPGAICVPTGDSPLNAVTAKPSSSLTNAGINENFRIYWDGDLCEETFNYVNGKNTAGCVAKYGSWNPIYVCDGSLTNNDTKGTPCYQGDILGDWREEIIMRTADNNIRIYSTPTATSWRIPSLWYDHQYRNAMVWQMCGYNQPPHLSYFLGELEGITIAPPPLTMTGRTEVKNGGSIGSSLNGQHVVVCETKDAQVGIDEGAQPSVLTFNVPSWVQGTARSETTTQNTSINYTYYTCNVTGGGLAGNARLVKQGDGVLQLPKADFSHTGNTDIWGGSVRFDGTMRQSALWLNRHTSLVTDGGTFHDIKADYGSTIEIGGSDVPSTLTADTLSLGFGACLAIDLFSDGIKADVIKAKKIVIERKTGSAWTQGGPEFLMPVIELTAHPAEGETRLAAGKYIIAELDELVGSADNLILKGIETQKKKVYMEDGQLILEIVGGRAAGVVNWSGAQSTRWDDGDSENFVIGESQESTVFVADDEVVFDDNSKVKNINIATNVYPAKVTVDATSAYTFSGTGTINGAAQLVKENSGKLTINGDHSYTGGNHLRGGTVSIKKLSNAYNATGNLGAVTTKPDLFTIENGATLQTTAAVEQASPMKMVGDEGGVLNNGADFRMNAALSGTTLAKKGNGCLFLMKSGTLQKLVMTAGSTAIQNNSAVKNIELQGGTLYDDVQATSHGIHVPKGKSAEWHLTYEYYTAYENKLTGEGTLTIVPRNTVSRVRIKGDWSQFEGTIKHTNTNIWLPLDMSGGMPRGTLDLAEGCTATNVCQEYTIGRLTGKGSLAHPVANFYGQGAVSGNNTWNIGNDDLGDFTFAGTFTDGGGGNKCIFNKIGSCTMTVSGKSNHTGATTVKEGTLKVSMGGLLGKGSLTVASGATLMGTNTSSTQLTNSSTTIQSGGRLLIGATETTVTGNLFFGGKNLTVNEGAVVEFGINRKANLTNTGGTCIQNVNRLTINGTIRIHYPDAGTSLVVGDSVLLWKDVTTVAGTPKLESEIISIADGLFWDTTDLARGILRVTSQVPTSLRSTFATASEEAVYDARGNRLATLRRGLNIIRRSDGTSRKVFVK